MRWRALAVIAVLAHSGEALAAAPKSDLDEHPRAASLLVSVEISAVLATLDELAGLGGANKLVLGFGRAAIDRALGFASADLAAWKQHGIDPAIPISVSLTFDGAALERRYARLLATDERRSAALAAPANWHVRVVVPAADSKRAGAFIRRLPLGLTWSKDGARGAALDHQTNATLREARGFVILDLMRPAFAAALEPPTEVEIAAALGSAPAAPLARRGAAALLEARRAAVVVWLPVTTIAELGRAAALEEQVAATDRESLRLGGPLPILPDCVDLSSGTIFSDAAVRIAPSIGPAGGGLAVELAVGGDSQVLAAALPRADHALALHRRRGASAWLSLWLASADGLRRVRRPAALQTWPRAMQLMRQCPAHRVLAAKLFAWPLMIGAFADDLAAIGPRGKLTVESFAGADAVVGRWHSDPLQLVGAISGTLVGAIRPVAAELLARVFGRSRVAGSRTTWGRGRVRPFIDAGEVGASFGGADGEAWLGSAAIDSPPAWLTGDEIGAMQLDRAAIVGITRWAAPLALLDAAKQIRARLFLRDDQLVLSAAIERQ